MKTEVKENDEKPKTYEVFEHGWNYRVTAVVPISKTNLHSKRWDGYLFCSDKKEALDILSELYGAATITSMTKKGSNIKEVFLLNGDIERKFDIKFRYHEIILHCSPFIFLKILFFKEISENVGCMIKTLEEQGCSGRHGRHIYLQGLKRRI